MTAAVETSLTGVNIASGRPVDSPSSLTSLLRAHRPGDTATVGWVDDAGREHTADIRLAAGPAS